MDLNLNYGNATRFITSLGVGFILLGLFILGYVYVFIKLQQLEKTMLLFLLLTAVLFTIIGSIAMLMGFRGLMRLEIADIRYKQEKTIREILEQDYLLAKIELAYLELNQKFKEEDISTRKIPREIGQVVGQAFDNQFYTKTYKFNLKSKKKSFLEKLFDKN